MSKITIQKVDKIISRAKLWLSLSIKSIVRRTKELHVLHLKEDFPGSCLLTANLSHGSIIDGFSW